MAVLASEWNPSYILIAVILVCVVWIWTRVGRPRRKLRLPPGPPGWPIIGNLPILFQDLGTSNADFIYSKYSREFGDIYKLQVGPQLLYVLSDVDNVRKVLSHSKVNGRSVSVAKELVFGEGSQGIVHANDPVWTAMTRLTKKLFRDIGVGTDKFAATVQSEVDRSVSGLDVFAADGEPCHDFYQLFNSAVGSILCTIVLGIQYDYEDADFKEITDIIRCWANSFSVGGTVQHNRLLCSLPFGPGKTLKYHLNRFKAFLGQRMLEAKSKHTSDKSPDCFMAALLEEMENGGSEFTENNVLICCMELLIAGIDTTTTSLSFTVLYLTTHPEVQVKCQQELDSFINDHGRMPNYSDRLKLPYIKAMIHESERHVAPVPIGIPHLVEEDLHLVGYDFPKGTLVVANISNIQMDPARYPEPAEFRPERFLDDGGEFSPDKGVIPFSVGRRACPGEPLARMITFLFVTNLLRRYRFIPPEGGMMADYRKAYYGGTRKPLPFGAVLSLRQT